MNQNRKKMRKSKNILLLILFLLCGVISYGQSITWDAAAGTIRCEGVAIGTTATVTVRGLRLAMKALDTEKESPFTERTL